MLTIKTTLLTASAATALLAAPSARAQQAVPPLASQGPQEAVAAADTAGRISEDIIVTAQKREQLLIDVPQSISVVSGAALERQVATNFQDYLKLVPGLQLNQDTPGSGRLIVRGLNTGGVSSTVAVYVDETPFGSSTGLANGAILAGDFDTFDVARVEVLRGPQGTLYGASSLGGVIKFITNVPTTDRVSVRGRAGIETTRGGDISYYGNAVVNVPLSDTLAVRASGNYHKNGGWIDSIGTAGSQVRKNVNDSKIYDGRASLLWKPAPEIALRLRRAAPEYRRQRRVGRGERCGDASHFVRSSDRVGFCQSLSRHSLPGLQRHGELRTRLRDADLIDKLQHPEAAEPDRL